VEVECGRKPTNTERVLDLKNGKKMERNEKLTKNAQSLRRRMTQAEAKLWYQFLCRCQPRFHRQYVISNYIADFYCHKAKLVVELDGSQHRSPEEIQYDQKRTQFLQSQGLTMLRFSNLDVMRQFESVCEVIHNALKEDPSCNKSETWY
jgi:very-short-patch-repair endonuclease